MKSESSKLLILNNQKTAEVFLSYISLQLASLHTAINKT